MQVEQCKCLSKAFFDASIIVLIAIASCREPDKKYLPLGADITLECKSPLAGKASFSGSFERRKNMREFTYMDSVYIQIYDFSENNRGIYRCTSESKILSVTSLEVERSTFEELVKFRLVGSDMLIYCKRLIRTSQLQWTWISSDLQRTATIKVENNGILSDQNFRNRLELSTDLVLKVSTLTLGDAGQYKCDPSDEFKKTIHLITVQVTASPSVEVVHGSNVLLTCSLSHTLPQNNLTLVWVRMTEAHSEPMKSQTLTSTETESSLLIEEASRTNINWTCIIYNKGLLVSFIPVERKYKDVPDELSTNKYETSVLYSRAEKDDNAQLNAVFLVRSICLLPVFVTTLLIVCRTIRWANRDIPDT